jgi:hypothetical protein
MIYQLSSAPPHGQLLSHHIVDISSPNEIQSEKIPDMMTCRVDYVREIRNKGFISWILEAWRLKLI